MRDFLSHLASERKVSASTQNQAKAEDRTAVAERGDRREGSTALACGAHADPGAAFVGGNLRDHELMVALLYDTGMRLLEEPRRWV